MKELEEKAKDIIEKIDVDDKKRKIKEIESESMDPNFWKNNVKAASKMQEMAALQKEIEEVENLKKVINENDDKKLANIVGDLEAQLYLSGKYDKSNAIFSIHAGQGGVDAMDFTSMLFRMYTRYFDKKGYKYEKLDYSAGEEAGIKSITLSVEGSCAYGYLKGEQGVHRLVRLSPFNAGGLRHTSFALVEILPQVEEDDEIRINNDDLEWNFFRASSHGGQNVQKVSSAVRLTHKPTGIVVTCQSERYQAQNRDYALKMLKSKLWAKRQEERKENKEKMKGEYQAASWGNAIRSYVLHPYQMVKDTRTQVETGNVEKILDGEIDEFIHAELKQDD